MSSNIATVTPIVRVLAYKIGAVDVPRDNRRMHKKPMPLLGGLSIFLGFTVSGLLFCDLTPSLIAAWLGGLLIILIGILDDKYSLNAWIKLLGQIAAAAIAVGLGGVQIDLILSFLAGSILPALLCSAGRESSRRAGKNRR